MPDARDLESTGEWVVPSQIHQVARWVGVRYGLDHAEIADLDQGISITVWQQKFNAPPGLRWLIVVASRRAERLIRSRVRRRNRERAWADLYSPTSEASDLILLLRARVSALDRTLRDLYSLRFRLGLGQLEAGRALGLSRAEVRTLEVRLIGLVGGLAGARGKCGPLESHRP